MEDDLNYSDSYTIKVTKVTYGGNFTHWEADLSFSDDGWYCGVTAPTMNGAMDEIFSYLDEVKRGWTEDDANRP